jgi:hypothetical protein
VAANTLRDGPQYCHVYGLVWLTAHALIDMPAKKILSWPPNSRSATEQAINQPSSQHEPVLSRMRQYARP